VLEQVDRVATEPDRGVDEDAAAGGIEKVRRLLDQDRLMREIDRSGSS
jgi:hypothetical protein